MIQDISDLKKLFKLCRDQGVDNIEIGTLKIKFGTLPDKRESPTTSYEEVMGEPTEEDLMFWSSDKGQQEIDKKVGLK